MNKKYYYCKRFTYRLFKGQDILEGFCLYTKDILFSLGVPFCRRADHHGQCAVRIPALILPDQEGENQKQELSREDSNPGLTLESSTLLPLGAAQTPLLQLPQVQLYTCILIGSVALDGFLACWNTCR